MRKIASAIWRGLVRLEQFVLIITGAFLTLLIFSEVVLRELNLPLLGVEELAKLFAFWLYFIGIAYATYNHTHITAGINTTILKNPKKLLVSKVIVNFISLILCGYVITWGYEMIMWAIKEGGHSPLFFIPVIYFQISIFIGIVLMSFYFLVDFIRELRALLKGGSELWNIEGTR